MLSWQTWLVLSVGLGAPLGVTVVVRELIGVLAPATGVGDPSLPLLRKLEKAMAVSGVDTGVPEENSGKLPGKLMEMFPEAPNATNSRISGTGKGKAAGNLGSTLPEPCPRLPCGLLFEIDISSLLEFFCLFLVGLTNKGHAKRRVLWKKRGLSINASPGQDKGSL